MINDDNTIKEVLAEENPEDYATALLKTSWFLTSLQEEGLSPAVSLTAAMTHIFRHVIAHVSDVQAAKNLVDACFSNADALKEQDNPNYTLWVLHEGSEEIH